MRQDSTLSSASPDRFLELLDSNGLGEHLDIR